MQGTEHATQRTEHKSFEAPEETREFPNGRAEILQNAFGFPLLSHPAVHERRALHDHGERVRTIRGSVSHYIIVRYDRYTFNLHRGANT